jgi:hypothetical protein
VYVGIYFVKVKRQALRRIQSPKTLKKKMLTTVCLGYRTQVLKKELLRKEKFKEVQQ